MKSFFSKRRKKTEAEAETRGKNVPHSRNAQGSGLQSDSERRENQKPKEDLTITVLVEEMLERMERDGLNKFMLSDFKCTVSFLPEDLYDANATRSKLNVILMRIEKHLELHSVPLRIEYAAEKEEKETGGYYRHNGSERYIMVRLMDHFGPEQLIAILCDACVQYFMEIHNLRWNDSDMSRRRADVMAILLGFGNYMAAAYQKRQVQKKQNKTAARARYEPGYLSAEECRQVMEQRVRWQEEQKRKEEEQKQKEQMRWEQKMKELLSLPENKMLEILLPECRRIFGKRTTNSQERLDAEREIKAFLELRKKLPERVQSLTGYEIAACGASSGVSGFHFGFDSKSHLPFQMIGWSAFENYLKDWPHPYPGIAFRIEKTCFGARLPLLFFESDDSAFTYPDAWDSDDEQKFIQKIYGNSSGISDLKVITSSPCRLEFRLTEAPQNLTVDLQDGRVNTQIYGGYVIQIPICGEFNCTFGEVTESGDVILHRDSFCMK